MDPLLLVDVANQTDQTRTKGFYIPRKVSEYSVYNSTVFNGVYIKQGKVDQGAQRSQFQTVTRQILIQQPKGGLQPEMCG